jgi:hypothetical protein
MKIVVVGRGQVRLAAGGEISRISECRRSGTCFEGPLEMRKAIWALVASRGNSQMRALMYRYLTRETSG